MMRAYEEVQDKHLTGFDRTDGKETWTFTADNASGARNPTNVPLIPDPGPEKLFEWFQNLVATFEEEHGYKPGHVLFARQKDRVGLAACIWGPPAECTLVQKFDFEP